MATIEQRRKTDRERRERWRKKKLSEGNKQIQIMITPEAQKVLKLEKERSGEPYVQIINRAIMNIGKAHPSISEKTASPPSIPEKTASPPGIPEKTAPRPGKSARARERARISNKTTAHSPEQLSLFAGSEN
ncbi:MAG: hypothetical protein WBI57_14585 [Desulfobacterales bacterium]